MEREPRTSIFFSCCFFFDLLTPTAPLAQLRLSLYRLYSSTSPALHIHNPKHSHPAGSFCFFPSSFVYIATTSPSSTSSLQDTLFIRTESSSPFSSGTTAET